MIYRVLLLILLGGLAASCSGKVEDVEGFNGDDVEMNAAYDQARKSIEKFIAALEDPSPFNRYLVKIRVEADGEIEHMWAEPASYENGTLSGPLVNDPARIQSVKKGHTIQAEKEEISDWAIVSPDDEILEGGYTIAVMAKKRGMNPD